MHLHVKWPFVVLLAVAVWRPAGAGTRADAAPASAITPDAISAGLAGLTSPQGEAVIDDQFRYEYIHAAEDQKKERDRDRDHRHVGVVPEPSSVWMMPAGVLVLLLTLLRRRRARAA